MNPLQEYIAIIHQRQQDPIANGERHHIIPKSCGGCNKRWNLVRLTSEEHIECHRLLTLIYATGDEHRAMCAAYALMCTSRSKVKVSDEQAAEARRMMAESKKGRTTWMKGRHHTEESKRKQREIKLGKRPSAETRKKMGDAHRGKPNLGRKGKAPWNKGKHYKTGRSSWNKGKHFDEAYKKRMSERLKGREFSEETKRKIREAALRRWERYRQQTNN